MNTDEARARFHELRSQDSDVLAEELDRIWACLPTVGIPEIIGQWRGDDFATGHHFNELLTRYRWYGKTFSSGFDAKPLVCYGEDGQLFSNVELADGEASLWEVAFRGEVTATMVYDRRPVLDHFKKVDDGTLMGIMNGKPDFVLDGGEYYYFLLERV